MAASNPPISQLGVSNFPAECVSVLGHFDQHERRRDGSAFLDDIPFDAPLPANERRRAVFGQIVHAVLSQKIQRVLLGCVGSSERRALLDYWRPRLPCGLRKHCWNDEGHHQERCNDDQRRQNDEQEVSRQDATGGGKAPVKPPFGRQSRLLRRGLIGNDDDGRAGLAGRVCLGQLVHRVSTVGANGLFAQAKELLDGQPAVRTGGHFPITD